MKTKFRLFVPILSLIIFLTSCEKELSLENANTGTSVYTMEGSPGSCLNTAINGNFQVGVKLDTTSSVAILVNVTVPGTYIISSNTNNGIHFNANGTFTTTGIQSIDLLASGTPVANGTFDFNLGINGCTFSITCSGGVTSNNDCKDCSYFPICVGSKYAYFDTTNGIGTLRSNEYLSSTDTTIDGRIFKKITTMEGIAYNNCSNGETTLAAFLLLSGNGTTLQKYKSIVIKANAPVGNSWSDTLTNGSGQTVIQKFKIESKGISKTVGTFNFPDVIVVSLENGVDLPPFGYVPGTLSYYSYAKGIGLVEMTTKDLTSGQTFYHTVVKSYFIP